MTLKVFITGISGTIGSVLAELFYKNGWDVHGCCRDEVRFKNVPDKFKKHLVDIRNFEALAKAIPLQCDLIIHTAALKHVEVCEDHPKECLSVNVDGTKNVLRVQHHNSCGKVVLLSTDKAVYPINTYGASKMIAEKLVLDADNLNLVIRYGNVIASKGSAVPVFADKLRDGESIPITNFDMTRYWIRIDVVANFIYEMSANFSISRRILIPPIKAFPLLALIEEMADQMGVTVYDSNRVNGFHAMEIGMRPGEKLHECLSSVYENKHEDLFSNTDAQYTPEEMKQLLKGYI